MTRSRTIPLHSTETREFSYFLCLLLSETVEECVFWALGSSIGTAAVLTNTSALHPPPVHLFISLPSLSFPRRSNSWPCMCHYSALSFCSRSPSVYFIYSVCTPSSCSSPRRLARLGLVARPPRLSLDLRCVSVSSACVPVLCRCCFVGTGSDDDCKCNTHKSFMVYSEEGVKCVLGCCVVPSPLTAFIIRLSSSHISTSLLFAESPQRLFSVCVAALGVAPWIISQVDGGSTVGWFM